MVNSGGGKRQRVPEHHDPSGGGGAFVDERRRTQTQSRHMAAVSSSAVPFLPTAAAGESTLRASFVREEDERPKVPHDRFSDEVPVVSLQGIDDGGARRAEIRARVAAACEDWGIFQVVDHGVTPRSWPTWRASRATSSRSRPRTNSASTCPAARRAASSSPATSR